MTKKHIVVGISGGIAAYKTLTLIRLFIKNGYEVKVVATAHALQFVTPLTIETLSNNKLYVDMFEVNQERTTTHIALSQWADVCVLAPATAKPTGLNSTSSSARPNLKSLLASVTVDVGRNADDTIILLLASTLIPSKLLNIVSAE